MAKYKKPVSPPLRFPVKMWLPRPLSAQRNRRSNKRTKESDNKRNLKKEKTSNPEKSHLPQLLLLRPHLLQPLSPFPLLPLRRLAGLVVSLSCHRWA